MHHPFSIAVFDRSTKTAGLSTDRDRIDSGWFWIEQFLSTSASWRFLYHLFHDSVIPTRITEVRSNDPSVYVTAARWNEMITLHFRRCIHNFGKERKEWRNYMRFWPPYAGALAQWSKSAALSSEGSLRLWVRPWGRRFHSCYSFFYHILTGIRSEMPEYDRFRLSQWAAVFSLVA